jgi:cytochrome P450 family 4
LGYSLYELAKNQELQMKCFEEIERVVGNAEEILPEHVENLEYIPLVIKEMQRLYQVSGIIPIVAGKDTEVGGYRVPKGTLIGASFLYLHHDEQVWKEPKVCRPERFTPEESVGRHPCSYIPFSFGPHTCPGNKVSVYSYFLLNCHSFHYWSKRSFISSFCRDLHWSYNQDMCCSQEIRVSLFTKISNL